MQSGSKNYTFQGLIQVKMGLSQITVGGPLYGGGLISQTCHCSQVTMKHPVKLEIVSTPKQLPKRPSQTNCSTKIILVRPLVKLSGRTVRIF